MTSHFFFKIILLLFNYSCLYFLPTPPPHPSQTHLPPCFHPPPWFCPCVLYSSSWKPFSPCHFLKYNKYMDVCVVYICFLRCFKKKYIFIYIRPHYALVTDIIYVCLMILISQCYMSLLQFDILNSPFPIPFCCLEGVFFGIQI